MAERVLKVTMVGDASSLTKALGQVTKAGDTVAAEVEKAGKRGSSALAGFGGTLKGFAGGMAAGFALDKVTAFGSDMLELGNKVATWRTKTKTVFEGSAVDVQQWAKASAGAMGMTDDQLAGMAAGFGDLLKPMGFSADQAAKMSKDVVGLSGALSAWSGGTKSAAEVSDILSAAMLGERDALKGLGISISAADVQARLAAKGQQNLTGAALQQAEAVATQELIFEKSTDAQKAWSNGTFDAIKTQNQMKERLGELKERIATAVLPAMNAIAGVVVENVIPALSMGAAWVGENWPKVQAVFADVAQAISALWDQHGERIMAVITRVMETVKRTIENTLKVIAGIVQVVTGIISGDWSKAWNGVKAVFGAVWDEMKNRVGLVIDGIKTVVEGGVDAIGDVWNRIKEKLRKPVDWVIENVVNRLIGAINKVADVLNLNIKIQPIAVGPASSGGGSTSVNRMHTGGIAGVHGMGGPPTVRPGEVPAILQRGEGVLPLSVMRSLGPDGFMALRNGETDETGGIISSITSAVAGLARSAIANVVRPMVNGALSLMDKVVGNMPMGSFLSAVMHGLADRLLGWVKGVDDQAAKIVPALSGDDYTALTRFMAGTGVPHRVTSTFRSGDPGYHGRRKAADFAGLRPSWDSDALGNIFHAFVPIASKLSELIYAGPQTSFNIKDGRRVGKYAQDDHHDHVHAAVFDNGGVWPSGTVGVNLSGEDEYVFRGDQLGGGPPVIHVTIDARGAVFTGVEGVRQLTDLVHDELARRERTGARIGFGRSYSSQVHSGGRQW